MFFGSYELDDNATNGKEGIEWLVLAKEDDTILVISRYGVDWQKYNGEETSTSWEKCTLRSWLNHDFFYSAFSEKEQTIILTTTVSADENPEYNVNPGSDTQDKMFLLSILEADKYFNSNRE